MPVNKDTIQTISYSNIANDFVAREGITKPVGDTSQARAASCIISQAYSYATPSPETIQMTAKAQPARTGRLPRVPACQGSMPAAVPTPPGTVPMPGKQQLTATTAATTMPELQGAVAKMRERMAIMSSSFGEERKESRKECLCQPDHQV